MSEQTKIEITISRKLKDGMMEDANKAAEAGEDSGKAAVKRLRKSPKVKPLLEFMGEADKASVVVLEANSKTARVLVSKVDVSINNEINNEPDPKPEVTTKEEDNKNNIGDIAKDIISKVDITSKNNTSDTAVPEANMDSPEATQSKLEPVQSPASSEAKQTNPEPAQKVDNSPAKQTNLEPTQKIEKKISLVTNVLAKNAARVKTSQEDIKKITEDILGLFTRVKTVEDKVSKLEKKASLTTNVLAKSGARVKTQRNDFDDLKDNAVAKLEKKASLTTNVLARNAANVKELGASKVKGDVNAKLASGISIIASSLQRINEALAQVLGKKQAAKLGGKGKEDKPAEKQVEKKDEGFFGLLKSLFLNPAVVAALAGIIYTILPKEWQDKLKALFSGFNEGMEEAIGKSEEEGFKGFGFAVKTAGIAIATIFGAKVIGGLVSAITTTVKIIRLLGAGAGAIKKMGKAGAIVGGAAVAAGAAVALAPDKKDEKSSSAPEGGGSSPEGGAPASGTPAAEPAGDKPSTSGSGIKPSAGDTGIKPSAKTGIKVPEMSGDDKPVMEMIKKHEGVRTKPYKDSVGLWTVGVGHLIGNGKSLPPEYNREFSMEEVDSLFAKDYQHHKDAAKNIPGYEKLNNTGKAALIDLTFNMGPAWYKKWPNFTKALAAGDTETAAKSLEDSKWYSQVGYRARTIVAMIRGSGGEGGSVLTDSSGQPVTSSSGEPVQTGSSSGAQVAEASQAVKQGQEPKSETQVASINASSQKEIGSGQDKPKEPIPSPIANRGSLTGYVRHNTAYA